MTVQEEEGRSDDADRLVRNLEWHGLKAVAHRLKPDTGSAADTLLAAAVEKAGCSSWAATATANSGNGYSEGLHSRCWSMRRCRC